MEIETPSFEAAVAAGGMPTPLPEEDRMARSTSEAKAGWDEMAAPDEAEKAARAEAAAEEDDADELAWADDYAADAREFRDTWNRRYSGLYGCFEDTTKIPNKCFTFKKPKPGDLVDMPTTLQIFSIKVKKIRGGLHWPLHVFGMVAIRDSADQKRNMVFDRSRDNCQILTQEVPYLKLTGPSRPVIVLDPVTFEVDLKVKGATESKDECLSFLAITYIDYNCSLDSCHLTREYRTWHSTLEFGLASMVYSLEATVALRVTSGEWPSGFRAKFTAGTASIRGAEIVLLDSGDEEMAVVGHGRNITLSRSVASVEASGRFKVCAKALQGDRVVAGRQIVFKPQRDGVSDGTLHLDFCTLDVTVFWSLVSVWENKAYLRNI